MRVLRYYPRAWQGDGGITNSVRRMAAASVGAGADVTVVFDGRTPERHADPFEWVGVPHDERFGFRRAVGLEPLLRQSDVLVLHSAWTTQNVHAAAVARRLGVPYVLEPRGAYDPSILKRRPSLKRLWWLTFERRLVHGALAIHTFFESEREHLVALGYQGPVVVAPNGITPPADVQWDGGSGGYVLWIGRFDPEHKGLYTLLEGLRHLAPAERPTLRLHGPDWVGGKQRVVDAVERWGLQDHVRIGDAVYGERKWSLIARARAFTYPSRWEGFGNSAAEAVVVGVPTLVTPYPFGRWLAERGAAVLAEPTPAGLAEGLTRVTSPSAAEIGRHGQSVLRSTLSWDHVARTWLRQVESVLDGRAPTAAGDTRSGALGG